LRGGEIMGLTVKDIDFDRRVINPRKQADDRTRTLRELKTKGSKSPVVMHPKLEEALHSYLQDHWKQSEIGLLFLNRRGRPLKRSYVVKFGLKPILKKLGMSTERVGLHAFRHGLGTALCERKANPATVQKILRHSDIRTTLKYYVHSDLDAQRQALNQL
jgi:integrase